MADEKIKATYDFTVDAPVVNSSTLPAWKAEQGNATLTFRNMQSLSFPFLSGGGEVGAKWNGDKVAKFNLPGVPKGTGTNDLTLYYESPDGKLSEYTITLPKPQGGLIKFTDAPYLPSLTCTVEENGEKKTVTPPLNPTDMANAAKILAKLQEKSAQAANKYQFSYTDSGEPTPAAMCRRAIPSNEKTERTL